jgi:sugar phosphate isomerase/epimerase
LRLVCRGEGEAVKIGTTLIPLVGWAVDVQHPEESRAHHLRAIQALVEEYKVQAVELNGDFTLIYPGVIDTSYYQQVATLQQELGFVCTLHLPFLWLDGTSLNEAIRQATMESVKRVLEVTEPVQVESYVLHLWGIWTAMLAGVQQVSAEERAGLVGEMLRKAELSLGELATLLPPASVCVENLGTLPFDSIIEQVDRLGMSLCLDVGHLTTEGGDALSFLIEHWDRIGEIHLHDALPQVQDSPRAADHLPLGEGSVDYVAFMDTLKRRGYNKVLILEMNTEPDLAQSLQKLGRWL